MRLLVAGGAARVVFGGGRGGWAEGVRRGGGPAVEAGRARYGDTLVARASGAVAYIKI